MCGIFAYLSKDEKVDTGTLKENGMKYQLVPPARPPP